MEKTNIPCVMRVVSAPDSFTLSVELEEGYSDLPREAILICLLRTSIEVAEKGGLNFEEAVKDILAFDRLEKMEIKLKKDVN